jgi:2-oxoglutarate ferredoxin oxidoreductase subunit beta
VTFNDHEGSTKSYVSSRKNITRVTEMDFVPPEQEILAQISPQGKTAVTMHDGSVVYFTSLPEGYDPSNRQAAYSYLSEQQGRGEIPTGLFYVSNDVPELHELNTTPDEALVHVPYSKLSPGAAALDKLMESFR